MRYQFLSYEESDKVALVTINRPPLNPLNSSVFKEITLLMDEIEKNNHIHSVVITGSGEKAFIAGADIHEMIDHELPEMIEMNRISRMAFSKVENLSKPVIAAINGLALGGGLELALCCDLRICSTKSKFSFPEVGLGIIPGGGGTQRLQKIVGQGIVKELLYFGEMFSSERAKELQVVNKIVNPEEVVPFAIDWAKKLAQKPSIALAMLKTAINTGSNVDLESGLTLESNCFITAFSSNDRKEGMKSFVEKRQPIFTGR